MNMTTLNRSQKIGLILTGLLMLAGLVTWVIQTAEGLTLTNMRNSYSWGLYLSALAFFVGNAAGGLVLTSSIYLFGVTRLKPFAKIGALTAFANVTAAMLAVIPDMGKPFRLFNLLTHPQFYSPLVWDVIVLSLYALLSLTYLYLLMLPDLSGKLEKIALRTKDRKGFSETWCRRLAPVSLLAAVGIHVVTAWIFATQGARGWWHSAVLAPDFIALAMASGTALVLMVCVLAYGAGESTRQPYRIMSLFIAVPFFIHLFFMYNDFVIEAWYGSSESLATLAVTLKENLPAHALEVLLPLVAVILLLSSRVRDSATAVVSSCCLLMLGVVVHRFLLMPAAFNQIPMTIQPLGLQHSEWSLPIASGEYGPEINTFVTSWDYFPSLVEFVIFIGVLAFMAFVVLLGTSRLPVINQGKG